MTEAEYRNRTRTTLANRRVRALARTAGTPDQNEPLAEGKASCPTSALAQSRPLSTMAATSRDPSATEAHPQLAPLIKANAEALTDCISASSCIDKYMLEMDYERQLPAANGLNEREIF